MATRTGIGVSQTLAIDLAKPGIPKVVYAMQGEGYTRTVSLRISDDGVQWTPPSDAAYQVSYCKPDGKGGTYSSYTTDSTKPAVEISGGRLDVVLIPQMLQVAGRVRVEVHMQHAAIMSYAERLSTFTFYVMVQASAESGITSTDYWAAARNDKVVLLADDIGAEANVTHTYTTLAAFFSTPRLGDTVVGSDGYAATVTAASGTRITVVSTGKQWVDFSSSGGGGASAAEFRVKVVKDVTSGTITADKTFEEINHAKANGQAVICYYRSSRESALRIGHILRMESASTANMTFIETEINADAGDVSFIRLSVTSVDEWTQSYIPLSAAMVQYSGTVGTQTVGSVKAALDALAIGNPLNMSADFVASGKDDISDWAVEAAAGSTTEYRIAPGIYQIQLASGASDKTIVTIIDDTVSNKRLVKQERITDEGFYQLYIGTASAPGVYSEDIVFGTDDGVVSINNRQATLPWYNTSDAGKVPVVEGNFVKWKNLMPQIEITLSSGESPAITSVTKDGLSVGSTVAEWANAVHDAVQKGCPIAFVIDTVYYRPSNIEWDSAKTVLQYLLFSSPPDLSTYFRIYVDLPIDGSVPIVIIDNTL